MAEPRELEAVLELARGAEPPALDALSARRMVRHAQAAALQRAQRGKLGSYALLCAAALLALVAGYVWQRAPAGTHIAVGASDRPLRIALKTGDSLLLAPGSEVAVLEQRSARRRVRLARGRVLFDVAKLGAGRGFEVQAEDVRVRVLGTVFSVEVDAGRTLVRVYEGRVAVGERVLAAPGVWVSRGVVPRDGDALFEREARQLVLARQGAQLGPGAPPVGQPVIAPAAVAASATLAARPAPAPPEPRPGAAEPGIVQTMSPASVRASSSAASPWPAASDALAPSSAPAAVSRSTTAAAAPRASDLPAPSVDAAESRASAASVAEARPVPDGAALAHARALVAAGDARGALELARARASHDDEALLLVADAARALGRHREARAHYLALAERGAEPLRARAAFAGAQLALHALADPADALSLIATFALSADQALLRERATALEVDALLALGRRREARAAALRYLAREPETATSRRMRELLGE